MIAQHLIISYGVALVLLLYGFYLLTHESSRSYLADHISLPQWTQSTTTTTAKPVPIPVVPQPQPTQARPLRLPSEYDAAPSQSEFCVDRFSTKYLTDLRDHATSYCTPESRSNLTCFHSYTSGDTATADSMCFARGARLDVASKKFAMDCQLQAPDKAAKAGGNYVSFDQIRGYWYNTGPRTILDEAVTLGSDARTTERSLAGRNESSNGSPRFHLLLHREGESNMWHCLMEIWSVWMTIDVLRISRDPLNDNKPFFEHPRDAEDTQVVILDSRGDGPYWDLWQLFASRNAPVRLTQLLADKAESGAATLPETNIIIPLAGASNTLWQNDWEPRDCTMSRTLDAFVARVLEFYHIVDAPRNPQEIVVTFIDRTEGRRLKDQEKLLQALKDKIPHVQVQAVDFASISFADQIQLVRNTDVLLGVHGAGLTHTMFMREGSQVVELQPVAMRTKEGRTHNGFRNLAAMRGLGYTRGHVVAASRVSDGKGTRRDAVGPGRRLSKRDGWHKDDVQIGEDEFLDIMRVAVKSLYAKGVWGFDAN